MTNPSLPSQQAPDQREIRLAKPDLLSSPIRITEQNWRKGTRPIVSIICNTYNHESFIADAINGFLMQETTFPVEILIHDDASSDRTPEIIRNYEARYPKLIKPIYQERNQYSQGSRPGIINRQRAKGDFFALCEGDDYWTSTDKLEKQMAVMLSDPSVSLCFHNAVVKYTGENQPSRLFAPLEDRDYDGREVLEKWRIPTASALYRRSAVHDGCYTGEQYLYGDIIIFLRCAHGGRLRCINEAMSVYRRHSTGITKQLSHLVTLDRMRRFIRHHESIRTQFDGRYRHVEDRLLCDFYLSQAKLQLKQLHPAFFMSVIRSFRRSPSRFFPTLNKKLGNALRRQP